MRTATMTSGCLCDRDDDAVLVDRSKTDPEAFGQLYDRYVARIYRFAFARCSNHADAEDITAQTFHRVVASLPAYEAREGVPFRAWLFRIATNQVIDFYRRGARRPSVSLDAGWEQGEQSARARRLDSGEGPTEREPGESLVLREHIDEAWRAVALLPPMQRRAVTLYFAHGLSHAEVGRAIGRSEAATKQLVYRAVKALRTALVDSDREGF